MVVTTRGEIDLITAPLMLQSLLEQLDEDLEHLIVDLSAVSFFSSAGLVALLIARDRACHAAIDTHLIGVIDHRPVALVFDLTECADEFAIHPSCDAALAAIA